MSKNKRDASKRMLVDAAKVIDEAQQIFYDEIHALAHRVRDEILPYFRAHSLDFKAGNGTWFITRPDESRRVDVDDEELPPNIRALLSLEVALHDYLGFYIKDIDVEGDAS